jgi:hypothetical protein
MKTETRANVVSGCSFVDPLERFARDFLRFTVDKLVVDVDPPCVGLLIMPDEDAWSRLVHVIEPHGSHELREAKAVAIYVPLTLAQRVRLASELQRVCPGEYDRYTDYDSLTHRSTIERFLRAVVQAEQFVKSNDEQARRIVALEFGYDASYVDSIWTNHNFAVTLPQSLLLLMESEARWRIENRLTDKTKVPNYLEFIYFDGLEAVKPDAVTIIH